MKKEVPGYTNWMTSGNCAKNDRPDHHEGEVPSTLVHYRIARYAGWRTDVWQEQACDFREPRPILQPTNPYELTYAGGANEHWNEEPGIAWLTRLRQCWPAAVWLNPQPREWWSAHQSIGIVRRVFEDKMYPLTIAGLDAAMRELT